MVSFIDNALDTFGKFSGVIGDVYSALTAEDKTSTTIGAIGEIVATAVAVGTAGPAAATQYGGGEYGGGRLVGSYRDGQDKAAVRRELRRDRFGAWLYRHYLPLALGWSVLLLATGGDDALAGGTEEASVNANLDSAHDSGQGYGDFWRTQ